MPICCCMRGLSEHMNAETHKSCNEMKQMCSFKQSNGFT